jgi:gluconokinase
LKQPLNLAIFVTGVSGSGKSTVGSRLAARLGCRFLEGDDYHSTNAIAKMASGLPLGDEDRWPWLERLGETACLAVQENGVVVASCSALRRAYRERLSSNVKGRALFVQLELDAGTADQRMRTRSNHFMPPSLIASQFSTLEPIGPAENAVKFDARLDPSHICHAICERLNMILPGAGL